ncbi:sulfite exporter TauE/SafE family protein [Desulfovibrio sp. TomC]|uniref:sulfite exporter TauE/SafE family protein n=1 Tax=Desulfovibrio sp. TomC TaxID=1562888 RepID=UPI0005743737|nr:sulfite exporter TauE/SafE family protein [Desulfovibrio sp. TomC]KHK01621.1 putative membrane protein [Desulfovibrio sp. TomC]
MDLLTIGVLCLGAFCAGFTQGLAGFGSSLVALPLLAQVFDLKLAVPVCLFLSLSVNSVMVSRLRGHIQFGPLALLLVSSLPGMPLGVYALRAVSGDWLKTVLAVAIFVFVANECRGVRCAAPAGRGWGVAAGFVAGCTGGALGINGPPIVAWMSRLGLDRNALRATLVSYFLLAGCGVVTSQFLAGLVTGPVLIRAAVALPALGLGIAAGVGLCGRISEAAFRRVALFVLGGTAASLLFQGVRGIVAG